MFNAADQLRVLLSIKGQVITIRRGDLSAKLEAVRGTNAGRLLGGDGSYTSFRTDDWLIVVADTGSFGRPVAGDVIEWNGKQYTIGHPDNRRQAVERRPGDDEELTLRIHSISEQP
ncbi:hypothetical protein [Schlesneria sp. DSM 10557]|uniref:hypothetical protein n=1 Tax=Schlesneria sp. DSM 10557 TaxID=3044399 RepID=UPI0035A0922E